MASIHRVLFNENSFSSFPRFNAENLDVTEHACDRFNHRIETLLSYGESSKALKLLESLPDAVLLNNPKTYMHFIWSLLSERKFEQAKIAREFFETNSYRLLSDHDSEGITRYTTNTAVLGLLQFIFENDLNAISAEAMERVKAYLDVPCDYQFMVINIYSFLLFMNGRYEKARFFAVKAKMANAKRADLYNYAISTVLIALSDRALGRFDIAVDTIESALEEYAEINDSPACAILQMLKAMLLYDNNHVEEAQLFVSYSLPNLGIPAISEFLVHGYLTLIKIEIWNQKFDKAAALLNELESKLDSAGYQRWSSAITHERVRAMLFEKGYTNNAELSDLNFNLNYYSSRYCPAVGHIPLRTKLMVALHQHQYSEARNLLGQLSQVCLLQRDTLLRIILLSSTAVLEFATGNREEACEYLNQALRTSQSSGIVRALFDEVFGFEALFKHALETDHIDADVDTSLIAILKAIDFTPTAQALNTGSNIQGKTKPQPTFEFEALTQTEQKILQLLCQGLPNKAIAEQCSINISTVKWHLKNIYSKLYVSNRTEAVLKAQLHQLAP